MLDSFATMQSIANTLELDSLAPFIFFNPEGAFSPFFCRIVAKEEFKAAIDGVWDPQAEYRSQELGVFVWNCAPCEYCAKLLLVDKPRYEDIVRQLSDSMEFTEEELPEALAIFCMLHEIGHWLYGQEMINEGRKVEFCQTEQREREMCNNDELEYGEISSELKADLYAREHISKMFNRYKSLVLNRMHSFSLDMPAIDEYLSEEQDSSIADFDLDGPVDTASIYSCLKSLKHDDL